MEIRSFSGALATPKTNGRRISGYAVVFGVKSEIMYDGATGRMFQEIIEPGAITSELLNRSDVKAVLEHDVQKLLARSNKGRGTLNLAISNKGLHYSFDAPHTSAGDYAIEMVKRGDITGSSFKFSTNEADSTWTKDSTGLWLRKVKRIKGLYDVSIVSDPAYNQTSVTVERMAKRDDSWEVQNKFLRLKNNL